MANYGLFLFYNAEFYYNQINRVHAYFRDNCGAMPLVQGNRPLKPKFPRYLGLSSTMKNLFYFEHRLCRNLFCIIHSLKKTNMLKLADSTLTFSSICYLIHYSNRTLAHLLVSYFTASKLLVKRRVYLLTAIKFPPSRRHKSLPLQNEFIK